VLFPGEYQIEYVPVSSDFTYLPVDLSLPSEAVEHLRTLAGLSRFIIIDVTNLIPPEFDALILSLPHVPIQPILNLSKNDDFQPDTFFSRLSLDASNLSLYRPGKLAHLVQRTGHWPC